MHAGSFFKVEEDVLDKMSAYKAEQLYPIYPPSVIDHKELIDKVSQKHHTFPNVVAMIMAIESAGNPDAGSHMGAQGLMQVMPDKFPDHMQNDPAQMREPGRNLDTGVDYYVNVCLPAAQGELATLPADHPKVIAKAAIFYNGGPGNAGTDFDNLPDESKFYGDHIARQILTAQLAGELRLKGYTDRRIVESLLSNEIDARAFALNEFHDSKNGNYSYQEYDKIIKLLGRETIDQLNPFHKDFAKYLQNPTFRLPVSPGLRIWTQLGGVNLMASVSKNMDRQEWLRMNTQISR